MIAKGWTENDLITPSFNISWKTLTSILHDVSPIFEQEYLSVRSYISFLNNKFSNLQTANYLIITNLQP